MYCHLHGHLRHDSGKLSLINYYVFYSLSYHYIISLSLSYYIHLILYYILLYISSTFSVGTKIVVREVCYVVCHHVFPPPRISPTTYSDLHPATTTTTETDELMHDTTCFWSATDSNRIIIIISLARPLTYCGRDIWN